MVLLSVYREAAAFLREARQAGWSPRFIGWNPASDDKVVELAGAAAEGYMAVQGIDLWGDGEAVVQYRHLLEEHDPGRRPSFYHAIGYWSAQTLVEGLERTGRDLSREKLVEAMETLSGWDASVGPPLTYGPGARGGWSTAAFITRTDTSLQRMVRVTDWIPFTRSEQTIDTP